jgi:homoserine O-succinyltransferase/O-acetyltransferase
MFAYMSWNDKKTIRIAILDMYEGHANQGMRCIREILNQFGEYNNMDIVLDEFDVRLKKEVPDTSYDIYISSGGPGSPLDSEGSEWEKAYFHWLHNMEHWNASPANLQKKYVFFICHSYQLVCRHYKIARVCKRRSTAFGVFPIHLLHDGKDELVFEGLNDPFYAVDSRDYQVIQPNHNALHQMGATILCVEKERPHVPLERAIMAIRFNDYFIGTQFHPEADAIGMSLHLQTEEKKKTVIENYGEEKWSSMIEHLNDPDKIMLTYSHVLPNFLHAAVGELVFSL